MRRKNKTKSILIVADISAGASARSILSGIFRFVNEGHNWAIRLIQSPRDFTPEVFDDLDGIPYDGFIVTVDGIANTDELLTKSSIPAVLIDTANPIYKKRDYDISFICNDDDSIIAMAFSHILSVGKFNSVGFVPVATSREHWSLARERAFKNEAKAHHLPYHVFTEPEDTDTITDRENLMTWLMELPKPTAIIAAWDLRATQVIDACTKAGLTVPTQVTILGIDNDELYCNSTSPKLTSVQPDFERSGFLAAQELNRLMHARKFSAPKTKHIPAKCVVERESSRPLPPAVILIKRTLAYIGDHASTPMSVADVVRQMGVSRRLLELRLRECLNMSIGKAILHARLKCVKSKLKGSRTSFNKIAHLCGFKSASCLSHTFKREVGISMKDYRIRNSKTIGEQRRNP